MQVQWVHSRSENSTIYKQSSSSIPFHTHPEVTLCSWQVVKIQELFSVLHKSILGQALHIWLWKKKCKICVCSFWSWAKMQMLSGTVNWLPLLVPSVGLLCDGCTCTHVCACACMHVCVQYTYRFRAFRNGFGLAENRQLLKESLSILVGRVKVTGPTQQSMPELMR